MKMEKKLVEIGGSLYLPITQDLAKYLEINKTDIIEIQDETGKHGKYASFWKKER